MAQPTNRAYHYRYLGQNLGEIIPDEVLKTWKAKNILDWEIHMIAKIKDIPAREITFLGTRSF